MRKAVFVVGFASVARHAGRDDRSDWAMAEGRMRSIQGGMPPALPGCPNFLIRQLARPHDRTRRAS